jgi:hypothetical protein
MRKIENEMLTAIDNCTRTGKSWKSGNTAVSMDSEGFVNVTLHGHCIAILSGDLGLSINNCGYYSVTTKSRLNAILSLCGNGFYIQQKNHKWILHTNYGSVNKKAETEDFESGWNVIYS